MKRIVYALACASLITIAGCSTYQEAVEGQKVAYRKAEKRESGLEIPPDLTAQKADEQFLVPGESASGAVSASTYYSGGKPRVTAAVSDPVLVSSQDIKIKRLGKVRSIEAKIAPEVLWPKLREFWKDNGFELTTDDPKIGLMETNWNENRAAIPLDGVRKIIGRVFDGIYSSNTRDRYRTRVEPTEDGKVEIFISHRGMEENYTDASQSNLQWMGRPNDPELEAEMINRLLVKLTGDQKAAIEAKREMSKELVTLVKSNSSTNIVLAEDFPLAWRRVGFGLDRAGFIVEDRDRANGVYYVKYAPDSASQDSEKTGFFGKIFGGKDSNVKTDQRYQVFVSAVSAQETVVRFASEKGGNLPELASADAAGILAAKLK